MDNFDDKIKKILSEDIVLSNKYKNTIRNALKERNKNKIQMKDMTKKILISGCACITITTSVVFAKDISNLIQEFFNYNKGMDTAVQNDYIVEPEMKYVSSENTQIKINNLLMDDFNLSFTLTVKFDKDINVSKISQMNLPVFIVTDEEKRILYCEDEDLFNQYCKKNNLNYSFTDFNDNYKNSGLNWYIKNSNIDNNSISLVYNLFAENYPRSKELNIGFSQIDLTKEINSKQERTIINGDWDINVQLTEKFYNREAIMYKVKNCSNEKVKVTSAVVYNTCMKLNLTIPEDKIYNDDDSEEIITQKIEQRNKEEMLREYQAVEAGDIDNIGIFYAKPYIETSTGNKYYPAESSSEDAGYSNDLENGIVTYWQTFTLTKYETTNNLKIYLKYKGEDICIELER